MRDATAVYLGLGSDMTGLGSDMTGLGSDMTRDELDARCDSSLSICDEFAAERESHLHLRLALYSVLHACM
jgi:hypothetical protein